MALIPPLVKRALQGAMSIASVTWNLGDADTGIEVQLSDFTNRSIQVAGTFASATVTIQGSNDGANWETLRDPQGVALTFAASGLKNITEQTVYVRAISSGGTGASITVTMFGRQVHPLAWS